MATKVTIEFIVDDDNYDNYETAVENFMNELNDIDMDVKETDHNEETIDNVFSYKETSVEIDSELFFNEVSMDTKSWSYDLGDLEGNKPVYDYVAENYPDELQMLKDGKIDYLEVYCDY